VAATAGAALPRRSRTALVRRSIRRWTIHCGVRSFSVRSTPAVRVSVFARRRRTPRWARPSSN
jgi:hypothetical protein